MKIIKKNVLPLTYVEKITIFYLFLFEIFRKLSSAWNRINDSLKMEGQGYMVDVTTHSILVPKIFGYDQRF